ncbi:hypothetical protein [Streptomyces sp. BBFR102]|uniref:hypothetical protein n=1 Tax=Streptomyces sp. BBFR102 TaxID=3448171 RepID=UPI003F5319B0
MSAELTRYDHAMSRIMNDRRALPLYATAARRRLVVAAHLVLTLAIGGVMAYSTRAEGVSPWGAGLVAVLSVPWMIATGAINGATRGLLELRERALDERQSAERARVRARAHRVMALVLAGATVGLLIAGAVEGEAATAYAAPVLVAVLAVHLLMPLWVAGLTVRDEPSGSDDLLP